MTAIVPLNFYNGSSKSITLAPSDHSKVELDPVTPFTYQLKSDSDDFGLEIGDKSHTLLVSGIRSLAKHNYYNIEFVDSITDSTFVYSGVEYDLSSKDSSYTVLISDEKVVANDTGKWEQKKYSTFIDGEWPIIQIIAVMLVIFLVVIVLMISGFVIMKRSSVHKKY